MIVLVLAIDTSSAAVTAGVVEVTATDVTVLAGRVALNARGHGELLAPGIAGCLGEIAAAPHDLGAVVAGTGPGPFTGLRVGLVTAAVLADTLGIPAYGVCSLDAIGDAARDEPALLVATDARRKEVYWARYERGTRRTEPAVDRPVHVRTEAIGAVAGQAVEMYDFGLPCRDERYPAALSLVRCAAERIRAHARSELLAPLYLRRPDAVASPASKPVTQ